MLQAATLPLLPVYFPSVSGSLSFQGLVNNSSKERVLCSSCVSCGGLQSCVTESRLLLYTSPLYPCALPVFAVCPLPPEPENGGYICHPRPCRDPLTAGSVIEYLCAEGYMLKGDYKYLTCKNGEWKPAMEISCRLNEGQSGSWKRDAAGVLLSVNSQDTMHASSRAPFAVVQPRPV